MSDSGNVLTDRDYDDVGAGAGATTGIGARAGAVAGTFAVTFPVSTAVDAVSVPSETATLVVP